MRVEVNVEKGRDRAVVHMTETTLRDLLHAVRKAHLGKNGLQARVVSEHSDVQVRIDLDRGNQESEGYILEAIWGSRTGVAPADGPDPDWLEAESERRSSEFRDCACIKEPKGDHGLEGYTEGDVYLFDELESGRVRVWYPPYYDIVDPGVFRRYFKPIEEDEDGN